MPSNCGLKVCTFNAKCEELDYKCCIKDSCRENKCGRASKVPDSLVAAMLAVTLLPSKADILNIQNVRNKCVVEHLLKEIVRVKNITDKLGKVCKMDDPAHILDVACQLNSFSGLCDDAVALKDALVGCKICNIDYATITDPCVEQDTDQQATRLISEVLKYTGVSEYDAYYAGSSLTLVKKCLNLCPVTKEIPSVDSLVLFFEYNGKKFVNVNLNLGTLAHSFEELGCKKNKVDSVVCFLKQYKDCGAVLMAGSLGDLDYDVPQLLYNGDGVTPDYLKRVTSNSLNVFPVPSDFPCDLNSPLYEVLEFLIKTCNADSIPYSWLLQYLRLKGCKKCCLYKLVSGDVSKCEKSCKSSQNTDDCRKCPDQSDLHLQLAGANRQHLRQTRRKSDNSDHKSKPKKDCKQEKSCQTADCVKGDKCCCEPTCKTVCVDKCKIQYKKCDRDDSTCEVRCKKPTDCCIDNKHRVAVDQCKDLCEKKSCCGSCAKGSVCEGAELCADKCDDYKYCDTLSTLKRELCLYNSLNKVKDPSNSNRYTGFYDHFNRCLDCKYPRGMFQAWAMCEDYERPCKTSRVIDNNSELLALDHFLVSDCLKHNITCASLSDLCIEKCGVPVKELIANKKFNAALKNPYVSPAGNSLYRGDIVNQCNQLPIPIGSVPQIASDDCGYVFEYGGSVVRSFFTNRVYCVALEFPHMKKGCEVDCGESLHGLGLTSLWSAVCKFGSHHVDIEEFERFGLDKHQYFRDFFWKSYSRNPSTLFGSEKAQNSVFSKFLADCDGLSYLHVQKRDRITEEEFYKHLLCVYSNVDNRDRFLVTIATMEALYKICKTKSLLDCEGKQKVDKLLCDKRKIAKILFFLSECMCDVVKVKQYSDCLTSGNPSGRDGGCGCDNSTLLNDLIGSDCAEQVVDAFHVLSLALKDNCLFLEVLSRHASRALVLGDDTVCGCGDDASLQLLSTVVSNDTEELNRLVSCVYDAYFCNTSCDECKIKRLIKELLCGVSPKEFLHKVSDVCCDGKDTVNTMFRIITKPVCEVLAGCSPP
jgi:hypothetical protein